MPNEPPKSKWHAIKQQSEESPDAPINSNAKIKRLYLDTQIGSPVDTIEELDAQLRNIGPKDTETEIKTLNHEKKETTPNAQEEQETTPRP